MPINVSSRPNMSIMNLTKSNEVNALKIGAIRLNGKVKANITSANMNKRDITTNKIAFALIKVRTSRYTPRLIVSLFMTTKRIKKSINPISLESTILNIFIEIRKAIVFLMVKV